MAYILNGNKIIKVIPKSNDAILKHIFIKDNSYDRDRISLIFDFKINILFEDEIFEIEGTFSKYFNEYYTEEKDMFYISIDNKYRLSDKLLNSISKIEEYIINNLTNIELKEDKSERFILKHNYLNNQPERYLNVHTHYLSSHNRPILSYDYNTRDYVAELTEGLLEELKKHYKTDFNEFEKIEVE